MRRRGGVTSGYVSGAGSVGQPSYSPELAQGVLVLAELARCGRAGLTAAARLAMSALVRVRVRFRTGLASEAYQLACTPPTVVRGRGARIGGPSDYCNLRSSSWAREAGRVGADLEAPPHALQVGFDLAAHGLVLQPTLGDDLRGAVPHHPRAQSSWPRAMDVDGTRHGVRRRQVRRRRSHRLQPLKARLALGQCLLHRSKLAPPSG